MPENALQKGGLPVATANITPERVRLSIQARFNPIRNLTPELLSQYLDSFRLGFFRNLAITWDAMERRDGRLQTVAPKRKKSVARLSWEILTVDDTPEALKQKEALEYFYNHLTATTALEQNERGGLALLIRQMMDAVGKRYAVHEIIWEPKPEGLTAIFRFCPLWWFEGTQGKLRFLQNEFALYGADMDPDGWMVTVGDGIMEACSVAYIFKHMSLKDWLSYSEKFGMPGLLGKTDATKDSPEWQAFEDALQKFAVDWAAVCNTGSEIQLIEAKGQSNAPFEPMVNRMDEEMTRLWCGQDLGTSSKADAVGANLQAESSDVLQQDDAGLISETLTAHVSRFVLRYHFGDGPELAYIKVKPPEKKNTDQDLKIDQFLVTNGVPLAVKDVLERYNRPVPDDDEELLKAPANPAAAAATPTPAPADEKAEVELANGDVPGHEFHGNQWTDESLAGATQPLRKGAMLGDEVVFAKDGKAQRGYLSWNRDGGYEVEHAELVDHPKKAGYKLLARTGAKTIVSADKVRMPKKGFKQRDFANAAAADDLARALASDLQPFRDRLAAILEISDPAILESKLHALLADFDQMKKDALADPAAAREINALLAQGLVTGMEQGAQQRKP